MKNLSIAAACFSLVTLLLAPVQAGVEVTATKSLTVQAAGPRAGDAGSKYFNVQGKSNERYASFGVLVFEIPAAVKDKKANAASLTLVQSIPAFAKDGAVRLFLALDFDGKEDLKFDPATDDGIGSQIKKLHALGSASFKKVETGKTEAFPLTVDDTVRDQIAKGGKLYIVIVPADATVAATYFGANETAKETSPKLTLEVP
jgi:hypothetical protein